MNIPEIFGSMVFNDNAMKSYLSEKTYKELKATVEKGAPLSIKIAKEVANGMKNWATDKGATHFTHWFQPMTGVTAEKHDGFFFYSECRIGSCDPFMICLLPLNWHTLSYGTHSILEGEFLFSGHCINTEWQLIFRRPQSMQKAEQSIYWRSYQQKNRLLTTILFINFGVLSVVV